jgi:hypothetical protein
MCIPWRALREKDTWNLIRDERDPSMIFSQSRAELLGDAWGEVPETLMVLAQGLALGRQQVED